jgi:hypothetical protein
MTTRIGPSASLPKADTTRDPLETVAEALGRIRYGAIQLTVHDGRLVQVDVTERRRFT